MLHCSGQAGTRGVRSGTTRQGLPAVPSVKAVTVIWSTACPMRSDDDPQLISLLQCTAHSGKVQAWS